MALLVPNLGEKLALEMIVNKTAAANLTLHLFTNNITPGETNTTGSYTESSEAGYAAKTLTGASWDTTSTTGTASYAEQTFTYSTAVSVYGYFVKKSTTTVWAERFSGAPFVLPSGGGDINITPKITAD